MEGRAEGIAEAEVVLCGEALDATVAFFVERLGFRVDAVLPADGPTVTVVSGHGLRIRFDRGRDVPPGVVRVACADPAALAGGETVLHAPNGTRVELVAAEPELSLPPLASSLVVTRLDAEAWSPGRAGMLYRDLVPDRQGGRLIASHIRIPDGGDVPDYVHYHRVRFQLIHCVRGWVRVVYQDQGPPFVLEEGDQVLQPPGIRHRVLEASPGLEVVEVTSPAEHETRADHGLELPSGHVDPERVFGGQRFLRHRAAEATWGPWRRCGLEARDTGAAGASGGIVGARVVRPAGAGDGATAVHDAELAFGFVLGGAVSLGCDGRTDERLVAGDAFCVPAGLAHVLVDWSGDFELLDVTSPA
jgi:quercetin dioxygenase-like cupin family protein